MTKAKCRKDPKSGRWVCKYFGVLEGSVPVGIGETPMAAFLDMYRTYQEWLWISAAGRKQVPILKQEEIYERTI